MDQIKDAFDKVKQDTDSLKDEITLLKESFKEMKERMIELCEIVGDLSKEMGNLSLDRQTNRQTDKPTGQLEGSPTLPSTHNLNTPTVSTHSSTDSTDIRALNTQNQGISTGNGGVPTDRQTDRQTNQQTDFLPKSSYNTQKSSIGDAIEILGSLDNLKKEIRLKFKRLTEQEMLVFTLLYQLSEENGYTDYKEISSKLGLSESSIRDYIGRLIKKEIPVEKTKVNNKNIQLSIHSDLKKIASLSTILELRGL